MRVLSWNTAGRLSRVHDQVSALSERRADIVCLQELRHSTLNHIRTGLHTARLAHSIDTLSLTEDKSLLKGPRQTGVLIASRWPMRITKGPDIPWPEKALSVVVESPYGSIEMHTVHVPPGSSNGWIKIQTLTGLFAHLARRTEAPRILCGDFNSPQHETTDGRVITWGQHEVNGEFVLRGRHRGGSGKDWDDGERCILEGLAEFALVDAFRSRRGFDQQEFSWFLKRADKCVGRRFDHIFVSDRFQVLACRYLHELRERGLSDHSPIEADLGSAFTPSLVT